MVRTLCPIYSSPYSTVEGILLLYVISRLFINLGKPFWYHQIGETLRNPIHHIRWPCDLWFHEEPGLEQLSSTRGSQKPVNNYYRAHFSLFNLKIKIYHPSTRIFFALERRGSRFRALFKKNFLGETSPGPRSFGDSRLRRWLLLPPRKIFCPLRSAIICLQ